MRDDLAHLITLTMDRSDWIIREISRGKRPYSPVPFLNGELFKIKLSRMTKNYNSLFELWYLLPGQEPCGYFQWLHGPLWRP